MLNPGFNPKFVKDALVTSGLPDATAQGCVNNIKAIVPDAKESIFDGLNKSAREDLEGAIYEMFDSETPDSLNITGDKTRALCVALVHNERNSEYLLILFALKAGLHQAQTRQDALDELYALYESSDSLPGFTLGKDTDPDALMEKLVTWLRRCQMQVERCYGDKDGKVQRLPEEPQDWSDMDDERMDTAFILATWNTRAKAFSGGSLKNRGKKEGGGA